MSALFRCRNTQCTVHTIVYNWLLVKDCSGKCVTYQSVANINTNEYLNISFFENNTNEYVRIKQMIAQNPACRKQKFKEQQ